MMIYKIFSIILLSMMCLSFGFSALSVTLSLSDSGIAEGDSTTLTATISGSDSGVSAELSSDGMLNGYLTTSPAAIAGVSTQAVGTVSSTTSKSWIIQGVSAGTYDLLVTVSGASSSTTGSTTLTVDSPANVSLQSSTCDSDSDLSDGKIFSVSYTLRNTGGVSATILNDATYSTTNFPTVIAPALTNYYIDVGAGQTKTVSWSFVADSGTSERTGDVVIDLTGANLSETITCSDYTIAATTSGNTPSGGGGGSSTAKYEFIAEQSGKTQVNYYTGKELTIRLKEQDSINIVPSVDVNVTYPDGTIETIKTTESGTIVFTPKDVGSYTFTYKSGTKTYTKTITVLAASVDEKTTDNTTPLEEKKVDTSKTEDNTVVKDTVDDTKTTDDVTNTDLPMTEQGMPWWGMALIILGAVVVIIIISYFVNYHPHHR